MKTCDRHKMTDKTLHNIYHLTAAHVMNNTDKY